MHLYIIITLNVKSPSDIDAGVTTDQEDADLLEYMMHVQSLYHSGGLHWVGGSLWDDEEDEEEVDIDADLLANPLPVEYGEEEDNEK